jgi:hypothetical protein
MKKFKLFLYTLLFGILMTACSSGYDESTCQKLVDKINSGEELTESDYSTMLTQYEAIVDELISKANDAKNEEEYNEILSNMSDKAQFGAIFESNLRFADLSEKNKEKYDKIQEKATTALNNLYEKFKSGDSGLGDFDSSEYDSSLGDYDYGSSSDTADYAEETDYSGYGDYSSSDDDDDDDSDSYSSSSSSENWDALLNSYDQYVTKYISLAKKAAKGDTSALSEYPSLMQKAQDLSEKIKDAQGEMSSSQWSRYMQITNKMAQAAQSL